MKISRDINELKPELKMRCLAFVEKCKQNGLDILITCTLRDNEAQDMLYSSGRTRKGRILTNLRGGESKHNKGLAFDFCILVCGKPDWLASDLYRQAGLIGEDLGLSWAGRWSGKLKELCHFEV